ncbi:MAG: AMP-binding protein [Ilumatobacteraceae bacterium]
MGEYDGRAARLARALLDAGLGPHSKVGRYLYNSPEHCETNFAALKIRGIPINVNYRYLDNEMHCLLDNTDIRGRDGRGDHHEGHAGQRDREVRAQPDDQGVHRRRA